MSLPDESSMDCKDCSVFNVKNHFCDECLMERDARNRLDGGFYVLDRLQEFALKNMIGLARPDFDFKRFSERLVAELGEAREELDGKAKDL